MKLQHVQYYGKVSNHEPFCIKQGVLYSLFVNNLLVTLEQSGLGVKISNVYCSAPMYADDLAPIASSPHELQAMIDIVSKYATKWRYRLSPQKSKIPVFGTNLPHNFTWSINSHKLEVVKEHFHLGILRSTLPSTANGTSCHINLSFFNTQPRPTSAPDPARDPTTLAWQLH